MNTMKIKYDRLWLPLLAAAVSAVAVWAAMRGPAGDPAHAAPTAPSIVVASPAIASAAPARKAPPTLAELSPDGLVLRIEKLIEDVARKGTFDFNAKRDLYDLAALLPESRIESLLHLAEKRLPKHLFAEVGGILLERLGEANAGAAAMMAASAMRLMLCMLDPWSAA